ncbi:hypothetical protein HYH03_013235 [Edaphochlamys debaryana]|uniref:Ricin B lectin domain-containing protein n=1 Tax=Edaphochlamys debaryana TaxID=47281 RepID=A0A836BTE2_9CHLO|nr:hypothetical protein HYH03_013235 [Edaphochlamys debaryana]|eukprot:KAG2488245.1 hypothetical protein HYH03_013235 [Edaphochlamys debaryana]
MEPSTHSDEVSVVPIVDDRRLGGALLKFSTGACATVAADGVLGVAPDCGTAPAFMLVPSAVFMSDPASGLPEPDAFFVMVNGKPNACLTAATDGGNTVQARPCSPKLASLQAWKLCRAANKCAPVDAAAQKERGARAAAAAAAAAAKPARRSVAPGLIAYEDASADDKDQGRAARFVGGPALLKGGRALDLALPDGALVSITDLEPVDPERSGLPSDDKKPTCSVNGRAAKLNAKPICPPAEAATGASPRTAGPPCSTWNGKLADDPAGYAVVTKCGGLWSTTVASTLFGNWLVVPKQGASDAEAASGGDVRYYVRPNVIKDEHDDPTAALSEPRALLESDESVNATTAGGERRTLQQEFYASGCDDPSDRLYLAVYVTDNAWDGSVTNDVNSEGRRALHCHGSLHSADLVLMVVNNDGSDPAAGVAKFLVGGVPRDFTFSVVQRGYAAGLSLAHEIGHLLGLHHDREQVQQDSGGVPAGYHYGPHAWVSGHCPSPTCCGGCWDWHWPKAVTSIMGYQLSPGCTSKNDGNPCPRQADFGYNGFTTCIKPFKTTWDLTASIYNHEHCGVGFGDIQNDPRRSLQENAQRMANQRTYGCDSFWPDITFSFPGSSSCWVGINGWNYSPMACNDACNGDGNCNGVTYFEGSRVCCLNYASGGINALRPAYSSTAYGSWGRPWSKKRGGVSISPPGGMVCPPASTWDNWAWRCVPWAGWAEQNYIYRITTYNGGSQVVDLLGGATNDGAGLGGWDWGNGANQKWMFIPTADGAYFQIKSVYTGKCWDVSAGGTGDGTPIQQWSCDPNNNNQKFMLRKIRSRYEIAPKVAPAKCANINGGNGAQLNIWTCVGFQSFSLSQVWT